MLGAGETLILVVAKWKMQPLRVGRFRPSRDWPDGRLAQFAFGVGQPCSAPLLEAVGEEPDVLITRYLLGPVAHFVVETPTARPGRARPA